MIDTPGVGEGGGFTEEWKDDMLKIDWQTNSKIQFQPYQKQNFDWKNEHLSLKLKLTVTTWMNELLWKLLLSSWSLAD